MFQQVGLAQVSIRDAYAKTPGAANRSISGAITDPSGAVIPSATAEVDCGSLLTGISVSGVPAQ
jgi:hypothetical protein